MTMASANKSSNELSHEIRILQKYVHVCALSIWLGPLTGGVSCINVAWHGRGVPVALLRGHGSPGCLQLVCIVGSLVSTSQRFPVGFSSDMFSGQ